MLNQTFHETPVAWRVSGGVRVALFHYHAAAGILTFFTLFIVAWLQHLALGLGGGVQQEMG